MGSIEPNEELLVQAWGDLVPNRADFQTHLSGLKRVRRNKIRRAFTLNESKTATVVDPRSKSYPLLATSVGVKFTNNSGVVGIATGHTYLGIPDTVMVSEDIWNEGTIAVESCRVFTPVFLESERRVELSTVSNPIGEFLRTQNIESIEATPWPEGAIEDVGWLLSEQDLGFLPEVLKILGSFTAGGITIASNGPEIWHYPEATIIPIIISTDDRFMFAVSVDREQGFAAIDQEAAVLKFFQKKDSRVLDCFLDWLEQVR